jgi:hypothetical protein
MSWDPPDNPPIPSGEADDVNHHFQEIPAYAGMTD